MFQKKKLIGLAVLLGLAVGIAGIAVVSFFFIETRTVADPLSVSGRRLFFQEQTPVLDRILCAEFSRFVEAENKYASENGFSVKWDYVERKRRSTGSFFTGESIREKYHCIAIDYEETLFSKNWGVQRIYIQSALRFFKMLNDIEEAIMALGGGEEMDLEKTLPRGDSSELVSTVDQFLFYELLENPECGFLTRSFICAELSRFVESENRYALENGLSVKLSYNGGDSGGVRRHDFFIDYEEGSSFGDRDAQRVYVETLRRFLRMLRNIDTKISKEELKVPPEVEGSLY